MKIEVDDDCIDHLVGCALIDSYINAKKRIKDLKKKKELCPESSKAHINIFIFIYI